MLIAVYSQNLSESKKKKEPSKLSKEKLRKSRDRSKEELIRNRGSEIKTKPEATEMI